MYNLNGISFDPGSFKDPYGGVLFYNNRVFRYFTASGAATFRAVTASGLLDTLVQKDAGISLVMRSLMSLT